MLVARLLADPYFDTLKAPEAARERAFRSQCGGSRATYHRYKGRLLERRGGFDMEAARAVVLEPPQVDLHTIAMAERRRELEELRDELEFLPRDEDIPVSSD